MVRGTALGRDLSAGWNPAQMAALTDLAAIMGQVRAALDADGAAFIRREGDKCHYVEEDAIGPLWKGQRFPMTLCLSGWAMLHNETAPVEDIYADARVPHDAYRPTFVRSMLMTPVGRDAPFAALGAYWRDQRSFTGRDVAAIERLAERLAEALKTAG